MHDPLVVVHELALPIPVRRRRSNDREPRNGIRRWRHTNPENLGEPVYPWWRPVGWRVFAHGHRLGLYRAATIWHVEPRGMDSGRVCRHHLTREQKSAMARWAVTLNPFLKFHPSDTGGWVSDSTWRWHVHHWRIQIHLEQEVRRALLERCEGCGRRYPWGYAPVSHQWDAARVRWRDGVTRRSYHHECSNLVSLRRSAEQQAEAIRWLTEAWRVAADIDHAELLHRLHVRSRADEPGRHDARWMTEQVQRALGWKYDHERNGYTRGGEFVSMHDVVWGKADA